MQHGKEIVFTFPILFSILVTRTSKSSFAFFLFLKCSAKGIDLQLCGCPSFLKILPHFLHVHIFFHYQKPFDSAQGLRPTEPSSDGLLVIFLNSPQLQSYTFALPRPYNQYQPGYSQNLLRPGYDTYQRVVSVR